MFRFFRRGGGVRLSVLLTAGALGLAGTARSQAAPPGNLPAGDHSVHPSAGASRLQEIKVELAWLGESSTFCYPLRARANAKGLEVAGKVPTEAVRQQALTLARRATALAVVDALVIQPTLPAAAPPAPGEELLPRVRWVLAEVLGERAATIEVGTRLGGRITLRGSVASWEDKHTISSRLRSVRGCACVINLLDVSGPKTTSPPPLVAPAPRVTPPPRPAPPTWKSPPPPKKKPAPPVMPHVPAAPGALPPLPPALPDVPPAKPTVKPPVRPRIMPPAVRAPASPYGGGGTHMVVSAIEEAGPILGSSPPTKVIAVADPRLPPAQPIATGVQAPPVSPYGTIVPAPAPLACSVREAPLEKKEKAGLFAVSVQGKPEKLKVGTPTRDWPTALPQRQAAPLPQPARQSMASRVSGWFSGKPKPKPKPRKEEVTAPPKTHNGWLAGSRPKLLSWNVQNKATSLRSEAAPRRRPAMPEKPYVTHGTVVFHEAAATPATITRAVATPSVERLRQRVLAACAGQTRNVRVEPRPDRSLQVTVTVANPEMEKNLLGKLLQLPEMTSSDVHLFIESRPDRSR